MLSHKSQIEELQRQVASKDSLIQQMAHEIEILQPQDEGTPRVYNIATPPGVHQDDQQSQGQNNLDQVMRAFQDLSDRLTKVERDGTASQRPLPPCLPDTRAKSSLSSGIQISHDPNLMDFPTSPSRINEREVIHSKALGHIKIEPVPDCAASLKNSTTMLCAKCGLSGTDALTAWITKSFTDDLASLDATRGDFPRFEGGLLQS